MWRRFIILAQQLTIVFDCAYDEVARCVRTIYIYIYITGVISHCHVIIITPPLPQDPPFPSLPSERVHIDDDD